MINYFALRAHCGRDARGPIAGAPVMDVRAPVRGLIDSWYSEGIRK